MVVVSKVNKDICCVLTYILWIRFLILILNTMRVCIFPDYLQPTDVCLRII